MREQTFDILARLASGLPADAGITSRAASLSASRKKGKKGSKNKKAILRCQQQVATCETLLTAQCNGEPTCIAAQVPCCTVLSTCDFTVFLGCLAG